MSGTIYQPDFEKFKIASFFFFVLYKLVIRTIVYMKEKFF